MKSGACRAVPLLASLLLASCASGAAGTNGEATLNVANTALAGGSPQLALQISQAVLARHPDSVPALVRQGDAFYALGRLPEAEQSYDHALSLRTNDRDARLGLGRVALTTDPRAALPRFEQILARDPHDAAALNDRGIAEDLLGRHAAAQADYRAAIAGGGATDEMQVNLALSLALTGDTADAVRLLRPIASEPGATPRVRQDLAVALVLDGQSEEANRILLTQMMPDQARAAIAAYRALRTVPAAGEMP